MSHYDGCPRKTRPIFILVSRSKAICHSELQEDYSFIMQGVWLEGGGRDKVLCAKVEHIMLRGSNLQEIAELGHPKEVMV